MGGYAYHDGVDEVAVVPTSIKMFMLLMIMMYYDFRFTLAGGVALKDVIDLAYLDLCFCFCSLFSLSCDMIMDNG
jgi:hypothetical protein